MIRLRSLASLLVIVMAWACQHQAANRPSGGVVLLNQSEGAAPIPGQVKAYFLAGLSLPAQDYRAMSSALIEQRWQDAKGLAKAYLQRHPGDEGALLVLATALTALRQHALAAFTAEQALRQNPRAPAALNALGLAHLAQAEMVADYRQALGLFAKACQADASEELAACLNLAHLYLELGQAGQALRAFEQAKERCQDCVDARVGEAIALKRLGQGESARRAFEGIVEDHPQAAMALFQLALYYRNTEPKPEQAAYYLSKVLATTGAYDAELKEKARLLLYSTQQTSRL